MGLGPGEVTVLTTLRTTQQLANRIQRAYLRRQPRWRPMGLNSGVWTVAASTLLQAHHDNPTLPIDPELFVAVQPTTSPIVDPWGELAQEGAILRYCHCVHQIIGQLRDELRAEVRRVRRRVLRGEAIEVALQTRSRAVSPLGRYIAACRYGRPDLAEQFRAEAAQQHRSCPLYRPASLSLLTPEAYPAGDPAPREHTTGPGSTDDSSFRWN